MKLKLFQNKSKVVKSYRTLQVLGILFAVVFAVWIIGMHPLLSHAKEVSQKEVFTQTTDQNATGGSQTQTDQNAAGESQTQTDQNAKANVQTGQTDQNTAAEIQANKTVQTPSVEYLAHVENVGWQKNWEKDGAAAGTTGQDLRMEALKIQLANNSYGGGLQYRAHVENIGWQDMKTDGQIAGTVGQALRIEAVQISLTGGIANQYDIYYRVHAENIGWMGWAMNGQSAGTQGYGLHLEAIQICLVAKGQAAPGSMDQAFLHQMIQASAHVQDIGWMADVNENQVIGMTGEGKQLEAFRIALLNQDHSGSIHYQAYVRGKGWQNETSDGQNAGTTGKNLPVEALKISLTGDLSQYYDISYQVYITGIGWMKPVRNGEKTGVCDLGQKMEAFRLVLIPKNGCLPQWHSDSEKAFEKPLISYQAHVENIGWMPSVNDGQTAGTTGRSLQVEAFKVKLNQPDYQSSVQYQAFVENIGWQNGWSENGQTAGTTGQNLRVEGLRMRLTGEMAAHYDIYYRVHVSNIGWLGWAKNGDPAGSKDLSLRVEAFQVQLVNKGESAPGSTNIPYIQCGLNLSVYQGSWLAGVENGGIAGNVDDSNPVQGLKVSRVDSSISGSIQYRSHISNVGWESSWTEEGKADGLPGQQNTEAIEMKLTGEMANYFDLYYSVYTKNRGWLGWAKNGESAGTKGYSLPIEAVRIKLVYKGMTAPGSTKDAFLDKSKIHVVVLDPGHDDYKPGAQGGGLHEEKLSLKIAKYCREELQRYGVTVYLTRETGACPGGKLNSHDCLQWRVNYAASKDADLLVSLHLNSSGAKAHGCEVLRQNSHYNVNNIYSTSKALSVNILNELHKIGIPNWGVGYEEKNSGGSDPTYYPDGSLADYYAILRHGKEQGIPSVIVEHCFISNASDRTNYLSSEAKLKKLGIADAHGILKTLGLM